MNKKECAEKIIEYILLIENLEKEKVCKIEAVKESSNNLKESIWKKLYTKMDSFYNKGYLFVGLDAAKTNSLLKTLSLEARAYYMYKGKDEYIKKIEKLGCEYLLNDEKTEEGKIKYYSSMLDIAYNICKEVGTLNNLPFESSKESRMFPLSAVTLDDVEDISYVKNNSNSIDSLEYYADFVKLQNYFMNNCGELLDLKNEVLNINNIVNAEISSTTELYENQINVIKNHISKLETLMIDLPLL